MRTALACAALLLLAGCAGTGLKGKEGDVDLQPGATHEVNVDLEDNQLVTWSWTSNATVAFDVHSHAQGGRVVQHETANGSEHSGQFVATSEGTYSLSWTNAGSGIAHVEFDIHTEGRYLAS